MKQLLLLNISAAFLSLNSTAQNVNIPDANFKAHLLANSNINTNLDTEIQISEAAAFTGGMNVDNDNISDLTGIEAFSALTALNCGSNSLTSLDVSSNTALTNLRCFDNHLTSLDVSANSALTYLICYSNSLTSLDVSANSALTTFGCYSNSLTSLDVSGNSALTYLSCGYNSLTSLDVSGNSVLAELYCGSNSLTSLDISANTSLTYLICRSNSLISLDVSANSALIKLICDSNSLTSLDVQNGNNINFSEFNAQSNPNLFCITVDDAAWSISNWSGSIDNTASFSENCPLGLDDLMNNPELMIYPNPASNSIVINGEWPMNNGQLKIMNMQGQLVYQCAIDNKQLTIDVSALSKGIYFLSLSDGEQQINKKFVKE